MSAYDFAVKRRQPWNGIRVLIDFIRSFTVSVIPTVAQQDITKLSTPDRDSETLRRHFNLKTV